MAWIRAAPTAPLPGPRPGRPVILVVNAAKVTRTAAASVLGCRMLDPELRLAGVVLNRIAGERHAAVLREAIQEVCGIPVLGALPRADQNLLPSRHLGLVTPSSAPASRNSSARSWRSPKAGWTSRPSGTSPPMFRRPPLRPGSPSRRRRARARRLPARSGVQLLLPENLEASKRPALNWSRFLRSSQRAARRPRRLYIAAGSRNARSRAGRQHRVARQPPRRGRRRHAHVGRMRRVNGAFASHTMARRPLGMAGVLPFEWKCSLARRATGTPSCG